MKNKTFSNGLTMNQIRNIVCKILDCQIQARKGYTKEQEEKNKRICKKFSNSNELFANWCEIISKIKINRNMNK